MNIVKKYCIKIKNKIKLLYILSKGYKILK